MSKSISYTSQWPKDLRKVASYPKVKQADLDLLKQCIETIAACQPLTALRPDGFKDHKMAKQSLKPYIGGRCFHLKPNVCVVYRLEPESVVFIRIGSHQDLGLTESL